MKRFWRRTPQLMSCHEVSLVLQAFLDDETDEVAAARVAHHLHDCVRCGMEAATYERIKQSIGRDRSPLDPVTVARLRRFGEQLAAGGPGASPGRASP